MTDFEYDREQVMQSKSLIDSEFDVATSTTLHSLDLIESDQTERKWGVEDGAVFYKQRFLRNVDVLRTEVEVLKKRADNFVAALQACVNALQQDEEDAVAAQQALQEHLRASEPSPRKHIGGGGKDPNPFGNAEDVNELQNNDSDGE